jgi:hypothetical protein
VIAVADLYMTQIVNPGKQGLFFLLLGFILTFLFIRFSVRMIRAGVSWWPGNISSGDVHVHHVVFGTVAMFVAGLLAFAPAGWESPWWEILGALFGIGAALVLDEFALILHLDDVYWSEEGRKSVEVVVLTAALVGLMLVGFLPFGVNDLDDEEVQGRGAVMLSMGTNFLIALIALAKGKTRTAIFGVVIPFIAVIGAIRLARPTSAWARRFYRRRPRARARSWKRAYRHDRRWTGPSRRLQNWIGGTPDTAPELESPTRPALPTGPSDPSGSAGPPDPSGRTGPPDPADRPERR